MQKLLFSILLGWLVLAQLGAVSASEQPRQEDFDELNEILTRELPNKSDMGSNAALIRSKSGELLTPGASNAGQLLLELVTRSNEKYCSNELTSNLLALQKTNLNKGGHSRINRLFAGSWKKALELCQQDIEKGYKTSPQGDVSFLRAFNSFIKPHTRDRERRRIDAYYFNRQLKKLAAKSDRFRPSVAHLFKSQLTFDRAFTELLVKPCEKVMSLGQLYQTLEAITWADYREYESKGGDHFSVQIGTQLDNLNWTRDVCTRILNTKQAERKIIFEFGEGL